MAMRGRRSSKFSFSITSGLPCTSCATSCRSCAGAPMALVLACCGARAHWRLSDRWRDLSLAMWREHLHPYARHARGVSVECARRQRPAAHAVRRDHPVLFLEHKRLYRETFGRAAYPGPDYTIPFGKARTFVPARFDVITYGAMYRAPWRRRSDDREHGVSVEFIDLRTLSPYDWEQSPLR